MFSNEYGEAAVEVLDILDNTNKADVDKIPKNFIKFLVDNASEDYKVNLDHSKLISEMNLKEKTKEILGVIYINWWCDKKDKENYTKQINSARRYLGHRQCRWQYRCIVGKFGKLCQTPRMRILGFVY